MGFVSQANSNIYRGDFIATYAAFKRTYSAETSVAILARQYKATVTVAEEKKNKQGDVTAVLRYFRAE